MPDVSFGNLFAVCLAGALAPLLIGFAPRLRLPAVVLEIVIGIDLPVQILSLIGLAFLLFLSGLEIDPRRLHGRLLRVALLGYLVTLALGVPIGLGADAAGWVSSPVLLVIALSATSLGLVGMRERALLLGGEITLTGTPGKGTVVRVWLPLP